MNPLVAPDATVEQLFDGAAWAEGPAWVPASRTLRFSDIPNNRILSFDPSTGATSVHREDAEFANGRTIDRDGNVVECSHGRRSVEREIHGARETIVDHWSGGRFNSPNDVVVASDGAIWFTDPPYGLHPSGREGRPGTQDYDGCFVFRVDPATGEAEPIITDMVHPNGLAFSPDESVLYVADTGFYGGDTNARYLLAYDVGSGGAHPPAATRRRVFATVEPGAADGFRVDAAGRVWTSSGDSVQVFAPAGELLLRIPVPETVSNLCFGGDDGHDLYITSARGLYRVRTLVTQAPRP